MLFGNAFDAVTRIVGIVVRRALAHRVSKIVGEIEHVVGAHRGAVGIGKANILAPGAQEFSVPIIDDDGMSAARENVDITTASREMIAAPLGRVSPMRSRPAKPCITACQSAPSPAMCTPPAPQILCAGMMLLRC